MTRKSRLGGTAEAVPSQMTMVRSLWTQKTRNDHGEIVVDAEDARNDDGAILKDAKTHTRNDSVLGMRI
jgi:hypothetical protein